MNTADLLSKCFTSILENARLAPSVHNTQPWKVSFEGDTITVSIDSRHKLEDGDPTGRQTIISLGIFCEAINTAAKHLGLCVGSTSLTGQSAQLHMTPHTKNETDEAQVKYLKLRCTDRSMYMPVDISDDMVKEITGLSNQEVRVWVRKDTSIIQLVAQLTSNAMGVALSSTSFRKELSKYLRLPYGSKRRGIDVYSLQINKALSLLQPLILRTGWSVGAEAKTEKARWLSASGVIVITAKGDMPKFWFAVGRTYLRVSLLIEKLGLSQATSAGIVEASNYHEDIETMLGTNERMLALLRVGKGTKKRRYSPRVSVEELTT